jgi:hypothetical protein
MIVQFGAGSGSAAAVAIVGNGCDVAAGGARCIPHISRPSSAGADAAIPSAAGNAANGEGMIRHE